MKRKDFLLSVATAVAGGAMLPGFRIAYAKTGPHRSLPSIDPADEEFWKLLREEFPLTHERAYLNTGGLGASPYVVIDAVKGKMDELERICETGHNEEIWKSIKSSAGQLLGCDADELAFTRNTTEGVNIVANGFPLKQGDEIITSTQEHVGNALTWIGLEQRAGTVMKFFEPSTHSQQENVDRIEKLITRRTRLISIPHIVTTTGLIMPIKEIARLAKAKNVWFFVDGAQAAGMLPFDLHDLGCDAWATSGHKWLMGPKETGLLYVRKEMLDTIAAKHIGAYSDGETGSDFEKGTMSLNAGAQRYEYGTVSVPLRVGLGAAIDFIHRIGMENVWKRDKALSNRLFEGLASIPEIKVLSPADDTMRSAMITFMHEKVPYLEVQKQLTSCDLRTRGVGEGGLAALRISTHIYTMPEEVDRVLEGARTIKKPN
jgi:cysteine desulfurase / selenocysteine lyase